MVGYLLPHGHEVASVRMIPAIGVSEEDTVEDNTVLFLSKCSLPATFEFYSPSPRSLIASQAWDIA